MKLLNKVAFVTGAAQGMGQAIVRGFVAEGAKVVAVDLNQAAPGREPGRPGEKVPALACNVGDGASVADAMGQAEQHLAASTSWSTTRAWVRWTASSKPRTRAGHG